MQSITLDLPCFEGQVTIGWSFSNSKYQKYLIERCFNKDVKDMHQEMESTLLLQAKDHSLHSQRANQ